MKYLKVRKRVLAVLGIVILLTGGGIGITYYHYYGGKRISSYEDVNGGVYECGKPIKAKRLAEPRGFGGYTEEPADQAEADANCMFTGIE